MSSTGKVTNAMIQYYEGNVRRINHFLKVYGFAKAIGELEGLDETTLEILELAALTHDIGIRNSEARYKSSAGYYQQIEGPPEAKEMLTELGFDQKLIERVCWLIAHHHTYRGISEIDHQVLVEADFLVNAYEGNLPEASIKAASERLFRTETGKAFLIKMYCRLFRSS